MEMTREEFLNGMKRALEMKIQDEEKNLKETDEKSTADQVYGDFQYDFPLFCPSSFRIFVNQFLSSTSYTLTPKLYENISDLSSSKSEEKSELVALFLALIYQIPFLHPSKFTSFQIPEVCTTLHYNNMS